MPNVTPVFFPEKHEPQNYDSRLRVLQKILGAIIDTFSPVNTNPTFLPEHHTPYFGDSEHITLQKILGAIMDSTGGGGSSLTGNFSGIGDPNGNGVLASEGASYLDLTDPLLPVEWKKTSGTSTDTGWIEFAG